MAAQFTKEEVAILIDAVDEQIHLDKLNPRYDRDEIRARKELVSKLHDLRRKAQ